MKVKILSRLLSMAAMLALMTAAPALAGAAAQLPEPGAPARATLEDGRVEVYAGTPRVADYQIGDSITIKLVFVLMPDEMYRALHPPESPVLPAQADAPAKADSDAPQVPIVMAMPMLSLEGLKMGIITGQSSDVEPLGPAKVEEYLLGDGKKMVIALFQVTTYVTTEKTQVGVVAEFMYAIASMPDGQPVWRSVSTPELHIGVTRAATRSQTRLIEGDISDKQSPRAPAALFFLFGSLPFAAPLVVSVVVMVVQRLTRKGGLTENEKTWAVIDQAISEAMQDDGYTIEHFRRIFNAVRANLGVLGMNTTETLAELGKRADLARDAVDYVFNWETVFFDPQEDVTAPGLDQLLAMLGKLIPRH